MIVDNILTISMNTRIGEWCIENTIRCLHRKTDDRQLLHELNAIACTNKYTRSYRCVEKYGIFNVK